MKRGARFRLWLCTAGLLVAFAYFTGVSPARTYLAQRASLTKAEKNLEMLSEQNDLLEKRVELLRSDAEIERLARERYNLVRPGEEAYAVLPPAQPLPPPTSVAPKQDKSPDDGNFFQQVWKSLTGRL